MDILISIAAKIAEYVVAPIGRQVGYLLLYKDNLEELREAEEELEGERNSIKQLLESETRNGKEIEARVLNWLKSVDDITEQARQLREDPQHAKAGCSKWSFPNLKSRHQLSRKAKKMLKPVADVKLKKNFDSIGHLPTLQTILPHTALGSNERFESRHSILNQIMKALADSRLDKIGVYGLGGVGKTTLMEEVASKARVDKLFGAVVMTSVKKSPDITRIQDEIADQLGLQFIEKSPSSRKWRLQDRIKREKSILIILDDLCARLDLEEVGIPVWDGEENLKREMKSSHPGYKLLLTSRSQNVLQEMGTKEDFRLEVLNQTEAWNLFVDMVGDVVKDTSIQNLATEVVKKCIGLPVLLVTVARALSNKDIYHWKEMVKKLDRVENTGMDEITHSALALCYNWLETEVKALFLLCGVMGPSVHVEYLLKYVMGLGIFKNITTVEDARGRLYNMIVSLQASCLLLEGDTTVRVQVHDIVHEVAVSIASRDEQVYIAKRGFQLIEWPAENLSKRYHMIRLSFCRIHKFPKRLNCPEINLFILESDSRSLQIPTSFFEGMGNLKVLDLTAMNLSSLPASFLSLTNLQTLCLDDCVLEDMTAIGALKNLEILSLRASSMTKLPSEIAQLMHLKRLDLMDSGIEVIPPNIISNLTRLEELYMGNTSITWEEENPANKHKNASLVELGQLPGLTALDIQIREAKILPRDLMFENLERYKIFIGDVWKWSGKFVTSKTLMLKLHTTIHSVPGIKLLIRRVEDLYLDELNGISNVLFQLNVEGFPHLKHLNIQNNAEIKHLINSEDWIHSQHSFPKLETLVLQNLKTLEKVCHGPLMVNSFRNLRSIKVKRCDRLRYLLPSSMVNQLSQLLELEVSECMSMKTITLIESDTKVDRATVEFRKLHSLTLQSLLILDEFFNDELESSTREQKGKQSANCIPRPLFSNKIAFPNLETLKISAINLKKIWDDDQVSATTFIKNLTYLTVEDCGALKYLFSSFKIATFAKLKWLEISKCQMMEGIIVTEEEGNSIVTKVQFPKLEKITIKDMQNLKTIWHAQLTASSFGELKTLEVKNCPKLVNIFPSYMQRKFNKLETLTVDNCDSMEEIFQLDANERCSEEYGTELKSMNLLQLPKLKQIWSREPQGILSFHNLQSVRATMCSNLQYLFPFSVAANLLQLENLFLNVCEMMTYIVGKKEGLTKGTAIFVLKGLKSFDIKNSRKLKGFYAGNHTLECSSLKKVNVFHCNKLKLFKRLAREQRKSLDDTINEQPLFPFEEMIHNLEELTLNDEDAKTILQGHFSRHLFGKLKFLRVSKFENEEAIFPYWFLQNMPTLERIVVEHSSFKEIFQDKELQGGEGKTDNSTQLKVLALSYLPQLQHICKDGFRIDPVLEVAETLLVFNCSSLKTLLPSTVIFGRLIYLEVESCHGLMNLFTCSVVRSLVNLRTMKIKECNSIEEIVTEKDGKVKEEIVFGALEVLELVCLPKLSSFCSSNFFLKFQLLQKLVVRQCPRMNTFSDGSTSTVKLRQVSIGESDDGYYWEGDLNKTITKMFADKVGFHDFKHLELSEYPELEEQWYGSCSQQEHQIFSNLKSLRVKKCDFLSDVLFPSNFLHVLHNLEELEVTDCSSLEALVDVKGANGREMQMKETSRFKLLKLADLPNLKHIWSQDPHGMISFRNMHMVHAVGCENLKNLEVQRCPKLENIFPSYMQRKFNNLETLTVSDCNSIEEIFQLDANETCIEEDRTELKSMDLLQLPKLKQIWSVEPQGILSFDNLQSVRVEICSNLQYLFPFSVAANLPQLENLFLYGCEMMKYIVGKKEGLAERTAIFVLKGLKSFDIMNSRKLEGFYAGNYTLECSSLKRVNVFNCNRLKLFKRLSSEQRRSLHDTIYKQSLFTVEEAIPNLEELTLNNEDAKTILQGQFSRHLFSKLKFLRVSEFKNEEAIFSYWFLQNMPTLETIVVQHSSFKEIFQDEELEGEEGKTDNSTQLKVLTLWYLPELQHICKDGFRIDPVLEVLETLVVFNCSSLKTLLPSTAIFGHLIDLEVESCHGLMNLFTCSVVRSLVKLTTMKIKKCNSIEEIVTEKDGEVKEEIVFGALEVLELVCLPKLNRFCSSKHLLRLQLLETVVVRQCPRMNTFSMGSTSAVELRRVKIGESDDEYYWEGDLNQTIRKIFAEKMAFHDCKHLELSEYPELKEIWYGSTGKDGCQVFSNLKSLTVKKCAFLSAVLFSSNVLQVLYNLEELEVTDCASLEVLIDVKGVNGEEMNAQETSQLKRLKLSGLPNLKHIWNKDPLDIISFRNLLMVRAVNCENLKRLFPVSLSKDLLQLQELDIDSCGLEEIFPKEDVVEECRFDFPQLTKLRLWNLTKLEWFYPGRHILHCPSMKGLTVYHCGALETFAFRHSVFQEANGMGEVDFPFPQPLFPLGKVCSKLERLALNSNDVIRIRNGHYQENLFQKIDELRLQCFHETQADFPIDFLERFPNLGRLIVRCSSFKTLFTLKGIGHLNIAVPPEIRELFLYRLEQLKYIWNEDIQSAGHVETPDSLHSSISFQNLTYLQAKDCKELMYLLSSSVAKSLPQLQSIRIINCEKIEDVVKNEEETAEEINTFKNLEYLTLTSLSSLRSFSGKQTFIFPSLVELQVTECPNMKTFSSGVIIAPILQSVTVKDERKLWKGDLNTTIQQLFKGKVVRDSHEN